MPNSQTMRKSRDSIIPDKLLVNSQILGRVGLYSFKHSLFLLPRQLTLTEEQLH